MSTIAIGRLGGGGEGGIYRMEQLGRVWYLSFHIHTTVPALGGASVTPLSNSYQQQRRRKVGEGGASWFMEWRFEKGELVVLREIAIRVHLIIRGYRKLPTLPFYRTGF